MQPKFEKGETVIFTNKLYPEYLGEHTVERVLQVDGNKVKVRGAPGYRGFVYYLSGVPEHIAAMENHLRKRHEPAEMGFHALLASLKNGVTREELRRSTYRR